MNVDDVFEEDLQKARHRAGRAITEDAFFDSRGARILKSSVKGTALAAAADDDIDEEVWRTEIFFSYSNGIKTNTKFWLKIQASLNRIRANKKFTAAPKELEIEDTINTVKRRARIDLGEKLLDAAGEDETGTTIRRRALKVNGRWGFHLASLSLLNK